METAGSHEDNPQTREIKISVREAKIQQTNKDPLAKYVSDIPQSCTGMMYLLSYAELYENFH